MDEPLISRKRFRWQIIPGTLQLIFGAIGLFSGPIMALVIWRRYQNGYEGYSEADVPIWCGYIVLATTVEAVLFLAGGIQWFRCRNKPALILSGAAIAIYIATSWWFTSRFPDL